MAIFHLPSRCLPHSLWLFCSFFSIPSVWLACFIAWFAPSPLHFTPPLSLTRRSHRNNIFQLWMRICPSPGLLGKNVGLFLCFSCRPVCPWVLNRANSFFCRTCWKLRSVLYKQSAGVQYLLSAQQQIHLTVSLRRSRLFQHCTAEFISPWPIVL